MTRARGTNDDQAPPDSPKGQFSKWDFWLNFTRPFEFAGLVPATYDGSVSGQWSDDLLFGSEQMSLGGYSSVRGVRAAQLFGNRAVMMRNEWSVQWSRPGEIASVLEPYVGFDCGAVFAQAAFGVEGDTLCGATLGLRNRLKARPESFFEQEVDFLPGLGYSFRQKNQWTWEAVK